MLILLNIGSRLFELFGKEVGVKKQPGRPLKKAALRAVCTRAQVQRLEESRLTIRGEGDQDPVASEEV